MHFYVRRQSAEGWRRGVVFVREIAPRQAIATLARCLYGEPYSAFPMAHSITCKANEIHCRYDWRRERGREFVSASAEGAAQAIGAGSLEELITDQYWGYTARGAGYAQYQVEHPSWRVWRANAAHFEADVDSLYGPQFVNALAAPPASALIADVSVVLVRRGSRLDSGGLAGE